MARPIPLTFMLFALFVCPSLASAQAALLSTRPASASTITLGQAAIPLYGPWKFTLGDSPVDPETGKPLWAEPGFDDASWETVDLTPVSGQTDPWAGDPRWVQGWQARGHKGYWGWAWYRLSVRVEAQPAEGVAIDGPTDSGDAWQLFANGQLLGSFGKFGSQGEVQRIYATRPLMFPVPPAEPVKNGAMSETLAFRVWMGPGSLADPGSGGLNYAPLLVAKSAMQAQSRLDWQEALLSRADEATYTIVFWLLALLSASLFLFDRSDPVYLWVAATLFISPLGYLGHILCASTDWLDTRYRDILLDLFSDPLQTGGWVMVWWVWFRLRRPAWAPRVVALLTVAYAVSLSMQTLLANFGVALPHGQGAWLSGAFGWSSSLTRIAFVLVLALVVTAGIREQGKEGWLALPVVVAMAVELLAPAFGVEVLGRWHGMNILIWDLTDPFLVFVLSILMLRRLLLSLQRQRQMALDVKQAQEVQQVILPQQRMQFPGLVIESEYRPAREVGGDFFQIIPHEGDGSLLIVAGDVTGKGLKAGMLVALLVGAIRSTADWTRDPLTILHALNRRLLGRGNSQATCLALRIDRDGGVTLANAGHLPPYLNGEPLAIEGALPLGIIESAEPSVMDFKLKSNDKLVLVSDGIAEATDATGNLFGFERVRELLRASRTAAEVAAAAQNFGQEDDISIISVARAAAAEPVLA
ncbi:MAG: PP2C family protein-serine/threonine phosphatase [Acidobacteriota bacterium]